MSRNTCNDFPFQGGSAVGSQYSLLSTHSDRQELQLLLYLWSSKGVSLPQRQRFWKALTYMNLKSQRSIRCSGTCICPRCPQEAFFFSVFSEDTLLYSHDPRRCPFQSQPLVAGAPAYNTVQPHSQLPAHVITTVNALGRRRATLRNDSQR